MFPHTSPSHHVMVGGVSVGPALCTVQSPPGTVLPVSISQAGLLSGKSGYVNILKDIQKILPQTDPTHSLLTPLGAEI